MPSFYNSVNYKLGSTGLDYSDALPLPTNLKLKHMKSTVAANQSNFSKTTKDKGRKSIACYGRKSLGHTDSVEIVDDSKVFNEGFNIKDTLSVANKNNHALLSPSRSSTLKAQHSLYQEGEGRRSDALMERMKSFLSQKKRKNSEA